MTEYINSHQYSENNSAFTTKCSLNVFSVPNYLFFSITLLCHCISRERCHVLAVFVFYIDV